MTVSDYILECKKYFYDFYSVLAIVLLGIQLCLPQKSNIKLELLGDFLRA